MGSRIQLFAILGCLIIVLSIFELIRRGRFLEKYSLLWFFAAIVFLILAIWRNLLEEISYLIGIEYAPSALFLALIFFGILMFLHFTLVISKLTIQNKKLAQEHALLKFELDEIKGKNGKKS